MHEFTGKTVLILTILAFLAGLLVIALNPDFRIENNIESNQEYYPSVKVDE